MSDRHNELTKTTRVEQQKSMVGPPKSARRGPTLSFKEVVAQFGIAEGKLKSLLRLDRYPDAPKAVSAFNSSAAGSRTYYDRAEIVAYVKKNMDKLK